MTNGSASDADRAWELMKKIGFAMLVTRDGEKLRGRPMSAYFARETNTIYLLTDARRQKDEEIARNPSVNLSFADGSSQKYVSLRGTAVVSNDRDNKSCFRRLRKRGGTVRMILIFGSSRSRRAMQNIGIRQVRLFHT